MRSAQNLDVRRTRTYHKCLGRVPRLAGNSGGWSRISTHLHSTGTAECDHKSLRAVRLKNPCLCLGSSHVHSMGLQFSVKPSGNSIRDRNSYLNTGKSNHCPLDGWMLEHSSECSWKCRHQSSKSTRLVLWLLRSPQQKPSFWTGRQRVTFGNCLWVPGQPESEAAFYMGKADASTKPQTFSQRNTEMLSYRPRWSNSQWAGPVVRLKAPGYTNSWQPWGEKGQRIGMQVDTQPH